MKAIITKLKESLQTTYHRLFRVNKKVIYKTTQHDAMWRDLGEELMLILKEQEHSDGQQN